MGRKAKFGDPKAIKGPGRKARKQGDPVLPRSLQGKLIHFFLYNEN